MAVSFFKFQFPGLPNVHCLFQKCSPGGGLAGNISFKVGDDPDKVLGTREELLGASRESGLESWSECQQVHGDDVLVEPLSTPLAANPEVLPRADGMMTSSCGHGLVIKTADCQPILFAHKSGKNIMAIHAGWRGNRMEFPISAMKKFCGKYEIRAEDVLAVRGPSLGPSRSEFINFDREWGESWRKWHCAETKCVDLWALTRAQLVDAGIPERQIYEIDICTYMNHDEFFSWRFDKNTGRQASIIWIAG